MFSYFQSVTLSKIFVKFGVCIGRRPPEKKFPAEKYRQKMVTELLNKYIWLIQKFIAAGDMGISLEELRTAWELKFGTAYARRSFNNHREAIEEVFGIAIECDRSSNRYFIRNSGDISDKETGIAWLIDTFTVNNMLSLSKENLSGRISVEEIPSGRKFLTPLMSAMQENCAVEFFYRKYGAEKAEKRLVHPYGIKESAQRWYLVGWSEERKSCRVYALDRIEKLSVLKEKFRMPAGFDIDSLFAASFGSYLPSGPGRKILFRAFGNEASYIRDLPLHRTQKEESADADSTTFSIFVSPDRSLLLEFLSHGPGIEVISPDDVRQDVRKLASEMAAIYAETETTAIFFKTKTQNPSI